MKEIINGIIVVEGKSDVALLSNYFDAEFVITNGSDIPSKTLQYLKKRSQNTNIFVLTDPDSPGKRIRDVLDSNIDNLKHCFIKKETSIKHGKVGVAEGDINEIKEALKNAITIKKENKGLLTSSDLFSLGLSGNENSNEKRLIVSEKLHLGYCNSKTFLKRLNSVGVTYEELKNIL